MTVRSSSRVPFAPLIALALAIAAGACSPGNKELPYPEAVASARAEKDAAFTSGADSPIPADRRARFLPLAYFTLDERYRVPAMLSPSPLEPAVEMPTSTGQRREMRRAGQLKFTVDGQPLTLTAFVEATDQQMVRLFVPFTDKTNGLETYAAGRYLDLTRTGTGLYDLDFNRAYQPYCYFNEQYDCPYPPAENRLSVPIRAGERMK